MLKRTTTAEFKPRNFFRLNQVQQGGAGTRHKPAINPTTQTKEVPVQEGPLQEQPPAVGDNHKLKQTEKTILFL